MLERCHNHRAVPAPRFPHLHRSFSSPSQSPDWADFLRPSVAKLVARETESDLRPRRRLWEAHHSTRKEQHWPPGHQTTKVLKRVRLKKVLMRAEEGVPQRDDENRTEGHQRQGQMDTEKQKGFRYEGWHLSSKKTPTRARWDKTPIICVPICIQNLSCPLPSLSPTLSYLPLPGRNFLRCRLLLFLLGFDLADGSEAASAWSLLGGRCFRKGRIIGKGLLTLIGGHRV